MVSKVAQNTGPSDPYAEASIKWELLGRREEEAMKAMPRRSCPCAELPNAIFTDRKGKLLLVDFTFSKLTSFSFFRLPASRLLIDK